MKMGLGMVSVLGALSLLTACGATPEQAGGGEEASSIELNLSTIAASGTEYRLGPATFDIVNPYDISPVATLVADGSDPVLHAPLQPGYYSVKLRPDWTLSRVDGSTLTPVAATLTTPADQWVSVAQYESAPVNYGFHLGESGIDIGVSVDEGIPAGYDARLVSNGNGQYYLEWRGGGSVCCFASVAEVQAAYGNANIYLAPS